MESVKINQLEIENVKRIKAICIEPTPNGMTIIGGNNNQGKTSVLDTIAWALGGDRYRPGNPEREGSNIPPRIKLTLSNGLIVERSGKNSALKVTDPTGLRSGQQLLNSFVEELAINLPKFMSYNNREKADVLLQIIGIRDRIYAMEQQEKDLYNRRRVIGQIGDQKAKFAKEMPFYSDAPSEPVSAAELIRRQQSILAVNGENQRKRHRAAELSAQKESLRCQLDELTAKYDQVGMYLSATDEERRESNYTNTGEMNLYLNEVYNGEGNRWDLLTEDEISIYYYIYNTEGRESAEKYLEDMQPTLTKRGEAEFAQEMQDISVPGLIAHNLLYVPFGIVGGAAEAVSDVAHAISGEYNPYRSSGAGTANNILRSVTAERINNATEGASALGFTLGDVYQIGMSSVDSAVGSAMFKEGYTVLMGMGAASSKARELYDKGASSDQILTNALISGALEVLTEYVPIEKLLNAKSAKTFTQFLKNALQQAGVEAFEEMISEIGNIIADEAIMGSQGEVEQGVRELMESEGLSAERAYVKYIGHSVSKAGAGGFLSGGMMSGMYSGVNYVGTSMNLKQEGRQILDTDNGVEDLRALANEMAGVKEGETQSKEQRRLSRYSDRAGKKQSAKNVGLLSDQVDTVRMEQNANDIAAELVKEGYKEKYARKIADAIVQVNERAADAETKQRYNKYMSDSAIASVNDRFYGNEDSSVQTRNAEYQMKRNSTALKNEISEIIRGMTEADVEEKIDSIKKEYTSSENSGSDVIADTGEVIRSMRVSSVEGGKMTVEVTLENGTAKTVNAADIDFANQDKATIYGYLAQAEITAGAIHMLAENYTGKSDTELKNYLLGVEEAYQFGLNKRAMQNLQFADAITSNQRTAAYRAGQIEAEYQDHLRTAEIKKSIAVNQQNGGKRKEGRVVYEDGLQESGLSEEKKTAADVAKLFSRATGATIHLFESRTATVNGEIFHTRDGKTPVQNGWYRNGEIWIDLNSGMDGRGIAVYTVAHELTHFIRQWSPSQFRSLSNFLVKTYEGKSVSITGLIRNQQAIARKNGQKLGYDEAWEEVVANSMESIMKDGKGVEAFLQLQQQNPTLWQKIKAWFADLVQRLKNMTVKPDSAEANLLMQLTSEVDRMAKMWATGVYEAGQNFQNANGQKNTANDGGNVKYSLSDATIPTYDDLLKKNPVTVVDISTPQTKGTFHERRAVVIKKTDDVIKKPYLNKDTNSYIFLTMKSYTHAFSNKGELIINATEHFPELVENAVLTNVKGRTHGNTFASNVFTFFSAADSGKTIVPVKLTVKEIVMKGQNIPKNILEYFETNGTGTEYAEMYDAVVLELLDVEEDPSGSDASSQKSDTRRIPSGSSTIRITDLLDTVKGENQKYIPLKENGVLNGADYLSIAEKYRDGTATEEETELLRNMVEQAAEKAGYANDTDWRMDHKAPNSKYDVSISQADVLYGNDGSIYSNKAVYYYGDGRSYDQKAIKILKTVRNNPEARITVYRAVPNNRVEGHVRNGDWVTITKEYAEEHGERILDGEYIRGFYLDYRIQDSASSFLELVKPSEKPSPSELPATEATEESTEETIPNQELWDAVHDYNRQIWEDRQSGLSDPWSYQQPSFTLGDFGLEDEIFAVISVPKIELEMPIYLGATADHLSLGAAHLSQTSLPVGGSNTNCVIAGHRGWHNGKYFYNIVSLIPGDEVQITNMWETLRYQVVETKAIESYEVEKIKIQPDRDMVTLLTCYYTGNNHKMRFAVYCERVYECTTEKERTE